MATYRENKDKERGKNLIYKILNYNHDEKIQDVTLKNDIYNLLKKEETREKIWEIVKNDIFVFIMCLNDIEDFSCQFFVLYLLNDLEKEQKGKKIVNDILKELKTIDRINDKREVYVCLKTYLNLLLSFFEPNIKHLRVMLQYLSLYYSIKKIDENEIMMKILCQFFMNKREETTDTLIEHIEIALDDFTDLEFLNAISVINCIFFLDPELGKCLYLKENVKNSILKMITNFIDENNTFKTKIIKDNIKFLILLEILKAINNSNLNQTLCNYNIENFFFFLKICYEHDFINIRLLSSVSIVKIWSYFNKENRSKIKNITLESLLKVFTDYIEIYDQNYNYLLSFSIEGLAYITLFSKIKPCCRSKQILIERLIFFLNCSTSSNHQMEKKYSPLIYGILVFFSNLVKVKDPFCNEEEEMLKKMNYINDPYSRINISEEESNSKIEKFNESLLFDYNIVDTLIKINSIKKKNNSFLFFFDKNSINLISKCIFIIYQISLSNNKKIRHELVKQGVMCFLLNYLFDKNDKKISNENFILKNPEIDAIKINNLYSIRTIANLLISVNFEFIFKKHDKRSCVSFLIELLGPDPTNNENNKKKNIFSLNDKITSLDIYHALLALTNLSSSHELEFKKFIVLKTFDYIDYFIMNTNNIYIEISTWELISNLIIEPSILDKFFNVQNKNDSKKNLTRLNLLIKLMISEDTKLQKVITGLLANATEYETVSQFLFNDVSLRTQIFDCISIIFRNQYDNYDLTLRTSTFLLNIFLNNSESIKNINFLTQEFIESLKFFQNHIKNNDLQNIFQQLKQIIDIK